MAFETWLPGGLSARRGRRFAAPVLIFLLVLLAGVPLVWLGLQHMEGELASERQAAQRAMGDVMTREIGQALSYGIPLEQIPDLESYLEDTRARLPVVAAVEVASGGKVIARAGDAEALESGQVMTLPLDGNEGTEASLRLARQPGQLGQALEPLGLTVLGAAGLAALLTLVGTWLFAWRPLRSAEQALTSELDTMASGDFARENPAASRLSSDLTLAALQEMKARVNTRCFLVRQQAAGLRAIDFDESLSGAVDEIMAPVEDGRRYRPESAYLGGLSVEGRAL